MSVTTKDGVTRKYAVTLPQRNVWWSPDNKKFVLWIRGGLGLYDVRSLPDEKKGLEPEKPFYKFVKERYPVGVMWSPTGTDVLLSEHMADGSGSVIQKIPVGGGAAVELVKHPKEITFYMTPESWYEDGSVHTSSVGSAPAGNWSTSTSSGGVYGFARHPWVVSTRSVT